MANLSGFTIVNESGEYYVAVRNKKKNSFPYYYYLDQNPVTREETVLDEETGLPVLDGNSQPVIRYVPSKLGMGRESTRFLESGGERVEIVIGNKKHWLIKMPEDFLIDSGYHTVIDPETLEEKDKVEDWSLGDDKDSFPFLPQRVTGFGFLLFDINGITVEEKISQLLGIKY